MNVKRFKSIGLITTSVIIMFLFFMVSCNKEDNTEQKKAYNMCVVQDDNFASDTYQDISDLADEAAENDNLKNTSDNTILSDCSEITHDTVSDPRVLTIDFGNEGCEGIDGRIRKGKIIVTYSGDYWEEGVVKTLTFDDYYVSNIIEHDDQINYEFKITGSQVVSIGYENQNGNRYYSQETSGTIEWADGDSIIVWDANHTREVIEGSNTWRLSDDVYQLSGSSSGTASDGREYTSIITEPLIRKVEPVCRFNYVQGVIEITPDGESTRFVDYGDGTCDRWATVTIDGNVYYVYLR